MKNFFFLTIFAAMIGCGGDVNLDTAEEPTTDPTEEDLAKGYEEEMKKQRGQ